MLNIPPPNVPPYQVIAVFDDGDDEPAFAYTHGVFEAYGGPELFVWATPDKGLDPGEVWQLSPTDQHCQLTVAVDRLRASGDLTVGATWDRSLDTGRSHLRVTVVEADDLPTYELSAGTPLRRLHLELVRPQVGAPLALTNDAAASLVQRTQAWAAVVQQPRPVWTNLDQPYGPGTAGVELVLTLLEGGSSELLWTVACLDAASEGGSRSAHAELDAVARTAGRTRWVKLAERNVDHLLGDVLSRLPGHDRVSLEPHVATALHTAVAAWVVSDLVDDELFRRGTATVRAQMTRSGAPEDNEPAPPERLQQVRRLAEALASKRVQFGPVNEGLEEVRAIWLLAWSGRGAALLEVLRQQGLEHLVPDARAWPLLVTTMVLDLAPDPAALLPPQHRAA